MSCSANFRLVMIPSAIAAVLKPPSRGFKIPTLRNFRWEPYMDIFLLALPNVERAVLCRVRFRHNPHAMILHFRSELQNRFRVLLAPTLIGVFVVYHLACDGGSCHKNGAKVSGTVVFPYCACADRYTRHRAIEIQPLFNILLYKYQHDNTHPNAVRSTETRLTLVDNLGPHTISSSGAFCRSSPRRVNSEAIEPSAESEDDGCSSRSCTMACQFPS